MFESMEIRKAANGFILLVAETDGEKNEYIFDTQRKLFRFIRELME